MVLELKYAAVTAALLAVSFYLEQRVYAHVDPGSNIPIFQSISAMITGTLFYFCRPKAPITRTQVNPANTREKWCCE
jgi:hypothetical protein